MTPQFILERLQQEHDRAAEHGRLLESANDKIVGFGITLVTAGFAYGVQASLNEMFFFLPTALAGVFLYAALQYLNLFWLGGYARALEDKINLESGQTLLYWETLVATSRPRLSLNKLVLVGIYLLVYVGISWYSLQRVFQIYGTPIGHIYSAFLLVISLLLLFAVQRTLGAYKKSYEDSRKAFGLT